MMQVWPHLSYSTDSDNHDKYAALQINFDTKDPKNDTILFDLDEVVVAPMLLEVKAQTKSYAPNWWSDEQ
jgi:hypothetical protein